MRHIIAHKGTRVQLCWTFKVSAEVHNGVWRLQKSERAFSCPWWYLHPCRPFSIFPFHERIMLGGGGMRNFAPRAGIESTSLPFWASMLTITPPMIPDTTTLPMPTYLCGSLPMRSAQSISIIVFTISKLNLIWFGMTWAPVDLTCHPSDNKIVSLFAVRVKTNLLEKPMKNIYKLNRFNELINS